MDRRGRRSLQICGDFVIYVYNKRHPFKFEFIGELWYDIEVIERLPPGGSWREATEGEFGTKTYSLCPLRAITRYARTLLHPLRGSPLPEGAFQLPRLSNTNTSTNSNLNRQKGLSCDSPCFFTLNISCPPLLRAYFESRRCCRCRGRLQCGGDGCIWLHARFDRVLQF